MKKDGFVAREFQGLRYYICKAFERIPHIRHGFSTRIGGSSRTLEASLNLNYLPWDSTARVDENRRRFLSALKLESAKLATLHQVHSDRVHIIEDNGGEWNEAEGDALTTGECGIAVAVKTADCIPILIADPVKQAVAAVHSGWKGTLSRILYKTVVEMQTRFQSDPSHLLVAIGPGIRSCCFEVGSDVRELFEKEYAGLHLFEPVISRPGKYLLDLIKALEVQLDEAGVPAVHRCDLEICTCCNTDTFFSYRAEGAVTGRMMSVIGMTADA